MDQCYLFIQVFVFPDKEDKSWVSLEDITEKLPVPIVDGRNRHKFSTDIDAN